MALMPYVIEKTSEGERSFDLPSRMMQDRVIMIDDEVNETSMSIAVMQLLILDNQDPSAPISMFINSPGGDVQQGLMLIDTMNFISAPVYTIATGKAASMGCAILAAGAKGHRYALPSAQILAHPMSGGTGNQRTRDNIISINYEKKLEDYLMATLAKSTGVITEKMFSEIKKIVNDAPLKDRNMTLVYPGQLGKKFEQFKSSLDFDKWMFPEEALQLGYIDHIITSKEEIK